MTLVEYAKNDMQVPHNVDHLSSEAEINVERFFKLLADYFNIEVSKLTVKKRSRIYSYPRHVGMYLLRNKFGFGYDKIGQYFNRDHSTAIYACNKVDELINIYEDDRRTVKRIYDLV